MEKSGSRASKPEIIDNWRIKSRARILLESFVTLAFWTGFLYLLIPMVTLLLWVFGFRIAYAELIGAEGLMELVKIIKESGIIIFIITLIIMAWGYYNYLLFRIRGDRRGSRVMICFDEDFASRYHLNLQTLRAAKEESRLSVTLADDSIKVEPASGPSVLSASPTLPEAPGRRDH
jgi:poly-beta-1,6-N-acetyl-D-glucosamine biosynthesis protein PgaD